MKTLKIVMSSILLSLTIGGVTIQPASAHVIGFCYMAGGCPHHHHHNSQWEHDGLGWRHYHGWCRSRWDNRLHRCYHRHSENFAY